MNQANSIPPDQTRFAATSPLYDRPVPDLPPEETRPELDPTQQKRLSPLAKIGIGLGIFLALIGVLVFIVNLSQRDAGPSEEISATDENVEAQIKDPLRQRLDELDRELGAASPTQEKLPFPPVDMELGLDN